MSYLKPIDLEIVQIVVDDLEDDNAHAICDLLRSHYGLPGAPPFDSVGYIAYKAAQDVFHQWRVERARATE